MNKKVFTVLNKCYAVLMFVSFFAGFIPVIPFIIALIIGGDAGPAIYSFLFNDYYPWVIALGSLSIMLGLIAMYVGKIEDLSLKSLEKKNEKKGVPSEESQSEQTK